jgi:putative transposase
MYKHRGDISIRKACRVFGVSISGYYSWVRRRPSKRAIEDELISERIKEIFLEHKGRYGSPRIRQVLLDEGRHLSRGKVLRLMRELGLKVKGTRYRCRRINWKSPGHGRPNLLNQCFLAEERNKVWLGDITYIPTKKGFSYLCVFLDVCTRKVTGWSVSNRMSAGLAKDAFLQAWNREHPEPGLIVHTDQGGQFTGDEFFKLLEMHQAIHSQSRRANPYDNAMMESFYRTIKRELIIDGNFQCIDDVRVSVFRYIETYYNTRRMHSALGYISPCDYEKTLAQK